MKTSKLNIISSINTLGLYLFMITILYMFIYTKNSYVLILLIISSVRFSIIAVLHSQWWMKLFDFQRNRMLKEVELEEHIELNFTNFIQLHKWTEKSFIKDKLLHYLVNEYYGK